MKVRDLVNQLQLGYLPDDEILVAYWDKEFAETALEDKLEGKPYPDEAWQDAIRRAEKAEYWQSCGTEEIIEQAAEALEDYKEASK